MSSQDYIRKEILPLKWCPGCGLNVLFTTITEALDELNLKNTVVVSGIGCTGRGAGFFGVDSVHGMHGRAIPLAVGMKRANPALNVVVLSGDGDLLGIGGNHLLHAARRNDDITVICNLNEVFAMTGRQASPTTKKGAVTVTSPYGNEYEPINAQGIIASNKSFFFGRVSPMQKEHMKQVLKQAMEHKGFSFVEMRFPCLIEYNKSTGKGTAEAYKENREAYKIVEEKKLIEENRLLEDNELGVVRK
jgi:2-oxoglutarate ferredoxin oxidoreductase subunit beta